AGLDELLPGDRLGAERREERVPALRRIAQSKAPGDFEVDAAPREILSAFDALRLPQRSRVELVRHPHGAAERLESPGSARLALWGQLDADALGDGAHGFGEAEPIMSHEEPEDVAAGAAAEAVKDATLGIDRERRRLLGVERAEPFPVLTRA